MVTVEQQAKIITNITQVLSVKPSPDILLSPFEPHSTGQNTDVPRILLMCFYCPSQSYHLPQYLTKHLQNNSNLPSLFRAKLQPLVRNTFYPLTFNNPALNITTITKSFYSKPLKAQHRGFYRSQQPFHLFSFPFSPSSLRSLLLF